MGVKEMKLVHKSFAFVDDMEKFVSELGNVVIQQILYHYMWYVFYWENDEKG